MPPLRPAALLLAALTLASLALLTAPALAQAASPEVQEVRDALLGQAEAWNRGDMDAFLAVYVPSDDLTFFSGGTVTRGFDPFAERFRARYGEDTTTMGALEFRDLEVRLLGPEAALARGEWHLERDGERPAGGLFTLILTRDGEDEDGAWRILHDHTSSFPVPLEAN